MTTKTVKASTRLELLKKLKPCPWCNNTVPLDFEYEPCECGQHEWVFIECERCGAKGPHTPRWETDSPEKALEAAAEWWNQRG